jgi:hypothetical protein
MSPSAASLAAKPCRSFLRLYGSGCSPNKEYRRLHGGDAAFRRLADAILGEGDRPFDDARDGGDDRPQRFLRIGPLGRP